MSWIKMDHNLADKPEVIQMADSLDMDEFALVGYLHAFWSWADQVLADQNGRATGVTQKWIDRKFRLPGFATALVSVGWLVSTEDGIEVPKFARHMGQKAKARAQNTARQQSRRVSRSERDNSLTECHAVSATKTLPDKDRDKDKDILAQTTSASARSPGEQDSKRVASGGAGAVDLGEGEAFLEFACIKGQTCVLRESKLAEWSETYPAVDVRATVREAWQWLADNPAKRKTASGISRFLGSWLGRRQNQARGSPQQPRAKPALRSIDDILREASGGNSP